MSFKQPFEDATIWSAVACFRVSNNNGPSRFVHNTDDWCDADWTSPGGSNESIHHTASSPQLSQSLAEPFRLLYLLLKIDFLLTTLHTSQTLKSYTLSPRRQMDRVTECFIRCGACCFIGLKKGGCAVNINSGKLTRLIDDIYCLELLPISS
jgi:hypothetical protein